MRTAATRLDRVERVPDKGDISHATDQRVRHRLGLTGWKVVDDRRNIPVVINHRDASARIAAGVGPDRTPDLVAFTDIRIASSTAAFGNVKILSSPRLSVINNQTALLKVVDNTVYFTIKADTTINQTTSLTTYTTTPFTVPVGFVMQVTPQISDDDTVLINVRPTISRITGFVNDPNPALAILNPPVISRIPEIQSREMESILRIPSGQIAVMGGLMQDGINNNADTVPGAASLPFFGNLFRNRVETTTKSELVIFLRPLVIRDASIEGDYRGMKDLFPTSDFLKNQVGPAKFPATPNTGGR